MFKECREWEGNAAEFSVCFIHSLLSPLTFVDPTWEHETVRKARCLLRKCGTDRLVFVTARGARRDRARATDLLAGAYHVGSAP